MTNCVLNHKWSKRSKGPTSVCTFIKCFALLMSVLFMRMFYFCFAVLVLTFFDGTGHCQLKTRIICSLCSKIAGIPLNKLCDLYNTKCLKKVKIILADSSWPAIYRKEVRDALMWNEQGKKILNL
ncbi:hypothetical protein ILYODFUR_026317 [Ilyodon furcidens]|uniref:Secreted protein n=1 Tax=Ilyodon furcidens TaxID=33524 RepID=A0ABV0TLT8_9TELE